MKQVFLQLSFKQELYSHQLRIFLTILTPGSMCKRWDNHFTIVNFSVFISDVEILILASAILNKCHEIV